MDVQIKLEKLDGTADASLQPRRRGRPPTRPRRASQRNISLHDPSPSPEPEVKRTPAEIPKKRGRPGRRSIIKQEKISDDEADTSTVDNKLIKKTLLQAGRSMTPEVVIKIEKLSDSKLKKPATSGPPKKRIKHEFLATLEQESSATEEPAQQAQGGNKPETMEVEEIIELSLEPTTEPQKDSVSSPAKVDTAEAPDEHVPESITIEDDPLEVIEINDEDEAVASQIPAIPTKSYEEELVDILEGKEDEEKPAEVPEVHKDDELDEEDERIKSLSEFLNLPKKKGRPAKRKSTSVDPEIEEESSATAESGRRGRSARSKQPPKDESSTELPPAEPSSEVDEKEKTIEDMLESIMGPRRRGRSARVSETEEKKAESSPAPRRRGRPPKAKATPSKASVAETSKVEEIQGEVVEKVVVESLPTLEVEVVASGPPKSMPVLDDPEEENEGKAESSVVDSSIEPLRRGRSTKVDSTETPVVEEKAEEASPVEPVVEPRKRGRSARDKSESLEAKDKKEESAEMPVVEETVEEKVEQEAQEAETSVIEPRKRGRPTKEKTSDDKDKEDDTVESSAAESSAEPRKRGRKSSKADSSVTPVVEDKEPEEVTNTPVVEDREEEVESTPAVEDPEEVKSIADSSGETQKPDQSTDASEAQEIERPEEERVESSVVEASPTPRKRGRPAKDRSLATTPRPTEKRDRVESSTGTSPPRKRGRPTKDRPSRDETLRVTEDEGTEETIGSSVEATVEVMVEPTVEITVESTVESTTEEATVEEVPLESLVESTVELTVESIVESTVGSTENPAAEPPLELLMEPEEEPPLEFLVEPTSESTVESTVEPPSELLVESTVEVPESTVEPAVESTVESTMNPPVESTVGSTAEPAVESTTDSVLPESTNHESRLDEPGPSRPSTADSSDEPPRKRGRPAKRKPSVVDEPQLREASPQGSTIESSSADASPQQPRKRGRPRTSCRSASPAGHRSKEERVESSGATPPRKRGRPAKERPETPESSSGGSEVRVESTTTDSRVSPALLAVEGGETDGEEWRATKLSCADCGKWFTSAASLAAHCLQHRTEKSGRL